MKRIFITIYVLLFLALITIPFGVGPIIDELFEDEVMKAQRDLAKGTFSLIAERLTGLDDDDKEKALATLQTRFGYPLGLYRFGDLNIESEDKDDFLNGLIIEEEGSERLAQRLGDSQWALTMGGPFPGDQLDLKATLIFFGLFLLFLTLPALAWTFFLNRDIKKIEKATDRFAAGDHASRVKVSKVSSLTQIASAFNHMAENSQKLLESQKELSNSVSHEIRTPLARIKFSLEMLLDAIGLDSNDNTYISEIGKDVEEIESLVDEMLTYAKFGREPHTSGSLSKNEMISWLATIVHAEQNSISNKQIRFNADPETDRFINEFEPVYLGWAVRNLVRNALKYAVKQVDISFDPGKAYCAIHVDDDGPGIPVTSRDKVFEPFFRLDESRHRESGGYGLGLAIAKRIAVWHKGSISAGDSPSKGSRFTIYLPNTSDIHL